jgi:hypothetical protein
MFDAFTIIQLVIGSCSVLADITTLYIIYDMGKLTGFLMLVASLSSAQLFYDLGFFFKVQVSGGAVSDVTGVGICGFGWIFFQMLGGVATTLITNSIACIVASIAFSLRSYDIKKNFSIIMTMIFTIAFIPAIICGVSFVRSPNDLGSLFSVTYIIYSILRVVSIVVNIIVCVMLTVKLNSMGLYLFISSGSAEPIHPVAALSSRMILYPVVQVITRAGAAWIEFGYPINSTENSPAFLPQLLFSIFSPAAGIGFFFIFINMQPIARKHLYDRMLSALACFTGPSNPSRGDVTAEVANSDLKARFLGNSVTHDDRLSELSFESGVGNNTYVGGGADRNSNPRISTELNAQEPGGGATGPTISTSRHLSGRPTAFSGKELPSPRPGASRGGSMGVSQSHSGNLDATFLPETLNHLDDDELGLLVDQLAQEHSSQRHFQDSAGMSSGLMTRSELSGGALMEEGDSEDFRLSTSPGSFGN